MASDPRGVSRCRSCDAPTQMVSIYGSRIRRLRLACGLGLREAAKAARISPTYLSRIELGHPVGRPSEATLRRIAQVIGDDQDALVLTAGIVPRDVIDIILADSDLVWVLRLINAHGWKSDWILSRLRRRLEAGAQPGPRGR